MVYRASLVGETESNLDVYFHMLWDEGMKEGYEWFVGVSRCKVPRLLAFPTPDFSDGGGEGAAAASGSDPTSGSTSSGFGVGVGVGFGENAEGGGCGGTCGEQRQWHSHMYYAGMVGETAVSTVPRRDVLV